MKAKEYWLGTPYLPTLADAYKYYAPYGLSPADVHYKLDNSEIYIGEPPKYNYEVARELVLCRDTRSFRWKVKIREPLFKVTGKDIYGKRFRIFTDNWLHALGINLWKGTVWKLDMDNKWRIAKRVW